MFGWIVTNLSLTNELIGEYERIIHDSIVFARKHNGRFKNDAIFSQNEKYIIILDGIITNKSELMNNIQDNWFDIILDMYEQYDKKFPDKLRGQFSGCIYNKITNQIFFFTNHVGDGAVFYNIYEENLIISNNFNFVVRLLKINHIPYELCENAIKFMCTFGFMLDKSTYIQNVFKLLPSECGIIKDQNIKIEKYHHWTNTNLNNDSENETIENLDKLFRQAIKREFEKDKEYGYKSVADLSGGLDARVINFVAKDMGYDMINISFSQKNSDEYKAMKKLNKVLDNELIYLPLDEAPHIYIVDKIVLLNYGLSFFAGAGGLVNILENLDMKYHGIEHGGVLGDMSEGIFPGKDYQEHTKPLLKDGMPFGRITPLTILDDSIVDDFENIEMFQIFGRGLMGGALPQIIRRQYTGYMSPYEDIDFYDYFLSIPLYRRGKDQILYKWIMTKYPQAYDVIEDKLMCKPSANKYVKKIMLFRRKVKGKLRQHIGKVLPAITKNNMNPMEYWYKTNPKIKAFIDEYYYENIHRLDGYESLKLIENVFHNGVVSEKLIALTVLSVMKQYF